MGWCESAQNILNWTQKVRVWGSARARAKAAASREVRDTELRTRFQLQQLVAVLQHRRN